VWQGLQGKYFKWVQNEYGEDIKYKGKGVNEGGIKQRGKWRGYKMKGEHKVVSNYKHYLLAKEAIIITVLRKNMF